MSWQWRMFVCVGLVSLAGCKKGAKMEPPPDFNKCDYPAHYDRIDKKGVPPGFDGEIFGVGDYPEDRYTSLEGHVAPLCKFVEGPNLKKQADGSLVTVAEGEVTGTCGSAETRYLVRKTVKLVPSTGSSIGGIGTLTEPFTIEVGKEREAYALRLDSCDRYIRSSGPGNPRWKLGTCAGIVDAVDPNALAKPTEALSVKGLKPGTCELEAEAGGVTMKFPITVTGDAAQGSAAGSADGSAAATEGAPSGGGNGGGGASEPPPPPTTRAPTPKKMSSDPEEGGEKK